MTHELAMNVLDTPMPDHADLDTINSMFVHTCYVVSLHPDTNEILVNVSVRTMLRLILSDETRARALLDHLNEYLNECPLADTRPLDDSMVTVVIYAPV